MFAGCQDTLGAWSPPGCLEQRCRRGVALQVRLGPEDWGSLLQRCAGEKLVPMFGKRYRVVGRTVSQRNVGQNSIVCLCGVLRQRFWRERGRVRVCGCGVVSGCLVGESKAASRCWWAWGGAVSVGVLRCVCTL